jgi:hypothetical protein
MIYFLVLAGMAKKVFKTAGFNHSPIPPALLYSNCWFAITSQWSAHSTYLVTSGELQQQLNSIQPSITRSGIKLFPCGALLKDGRVLERLHVFSRQDYERWAGCAVRSCEISDVLR